MALILAQGAFAATCNSLTYNTGNQTLTCQVTASQDIDAAGYNALWQNISQNANWAAAQTVSMVFDNVHINLNDSLNRDAVAIGKTWNVTLNNATINLTAYSGALDMDNLTMTTSGISCASVANHPCELNVQANLIATGTRNGYTFSHFRKIIAFDLFLREQASVEYFNAGNHADAIIQSTGPYKQYDSCIMMTNPAPIQTGGTTYFSRQCDFQNHETVNGAKTLVIGGASYLTQAEIVNLNPRNQALVKVRFMGANNLHSWSSSRLHALYPVDLYIEDGGRLLISGRGPNGEDSLYNFRYINVDTDFTLVNGFLSQMNSDRGFPAGIYVGRQFDMRHSQIWFVHPANITAAGQDSQISGAAFKVEGKYGDFAIVHPLNLTSNNGSIHVKNITGNGIHSMQGAAWASYDITLENAGIFDGCNDNCGFSPAIKEMIAWRGNFTVTGESAIHTIQGNLLANNGTITFDGPRKDYVMIGDYSKPNLIARDIVLKDGTFYITRDEPGATIRASNSLTIENASLPDDQWLWDLYLINAQGTVNIKDSYIFALRGGFVNVDSVILDNSIIDYLGEVGQPVDLSLTNLTLLNGSEVNRVRNGDYLVGDIRLDGFLKLVNSRLWNVNGDINITDHLEMTNSIIHFHDPDIVQRKITIQNTPKTLSVNDVNYAIRIQGGLAGIDAPPVPELPMPKPTSLWLTNNSALVIENLSPSLVEITDTRIDAVHTDVRTIDIGIVRVKIPIENVSNIDVYSCLFDAKDVELSANQFTLYSADPKDKMGLGGLDDIFWFYDPLCELLLGTGRGAGMPAPTLLSVSGFVLDNVSSLPVTGTFDTVVTDLDTQAGESGCNVTGKPVNNGLIDYVIGSSAGETCVLTPGTTRTMQVTITSGSTTDTLTIPFTV